MTSETTCVTCAVRRIAAMVVVLLVSAATLKAQNIDWISREDINGGLPAGIRVYEGTDPSIPLKAWYAEADLADTTWQLGALRSSDVDGVEPTSSFSARSGAWVAINGGYFGTGQSFSLVAQDGTVITPNIGALDRSGTTFYPTRGAFGVLANGLPDVAWIYDVAGTQYAYPDPSPNALQSAQPRPSATFPVGGTPWQLGTGIGGGPVIVEKAQPRITWEEEVFFGSGIGEITTRNPRTAVGYSADGRILLLVVDGRQAASVGASLVELANIMIGLGAVEAINLDGGGSTSMVASGTLLNRPEGGTSERQVASALVLQPRTPRSGGETGEPIYFDTGLGCCYAELGLWFESANAGYYGNTPSRLNETGTGEDKALFVLDQLPADTYEVSAWWVPAPNRATNTPFTVYHNGTGTTVRVDQSDPLSLNRWNVLGSFELTASDSVLVTDAATGSTAPSYVVVDAIRLVPVGSTFIDKPLPPPDGSIVLYPNPASNLIIVRPPDDPQIRLWRGEILDVLGRRVHLFTAEVTEQVLHLPDLARGVYVVRLSAGRRRSQRAFIVAH